MDESKAKAKSQGIEESPKRFKQNVEEYNQSAVGDARMPSSSAGNMPDGKSWNSRGGVNSWREDYSTKADTPPSTGGRDASDQAPMSTNTGELKIKKF